MDIFIIFGDVFLIFGCIVWEWLGWLGWLGVWLGWLGCVLVLLIGNG